MDSLLEKHGAYAISTRFFNWGEPLLNKRTPEFVVASRSFLMRASISSNLSLPIDATALVESGLDYLIMSIDGTTQETYQKYRKGGNLSLVMENVRRLVDAKKKLNSFSPYLVWQYLLFDHTLKEMDSALQIAKELGVNEINFTDAYDVSFGDPSITRPPSPPKKQHILHYDGRAVMQTAKQLASNLNEKIESAWEVKWIDRLTERDNAIYHGKTCQWLYNDMVMDALGNLLPCCYVPKRTAVSVFGNINDAGDHFNCEHYKFSREYFANQQGFKKSEIGFSREVDKKNFLATLCLTCPNKGSIPNVSTRQLPAYFAYADTHGALDREAVVRLATWDE
jgi:MoaA/NifB/PqqE/SkfB family radical SAM enzyme